MIITAGPPGSRSSLRSSCSKPLRGGLLNSTSAGSLYVNSIVMRSTSCMEVREQARHSKLGGWDGLNSGNLRRAAVSGERQQHTLPRRRRTLATYRRHHLRGTKGEDARAGAADALVGELVGTARRKRCVCGWHRQCTFSASGTCSAGAQTLNFPRPQPSLTGGGRWH